MYTVKEAAIFEWQFTLDGGNVNIDIDICAFILYYALCIIQTHTFVLPHRYDIKLNKRNS